ncbi:MAG: hypothetical protein ACI8W8_003946 [Rhodothermales bacterium]|jgi:hypothetical protein
MATRRPAPPSPGRVWFIRVLLLVGLLFAGVGGVVGLAYAGNNLFFAANPHFTLEHVKIEISKGDVAEAGVQRVLNLSPGEANIYDIDLGATRSKLLEELALQDAEVRRILPNTLEVTVYGRTPVARLHGSDGRLLDQEAVVLTGENVLLASGLPIITGVRNANSFEPGTQLDNPLVLVALYVLECKDLLTHGDWLDVHFIKLEPTLKQLHVYLRENNRLFIREDAVIILPAKDVKTQLGKALRILKMRAEAGKATSVIDATYERRIPVRTHPGRP